MHIHALLATALVGFAVAEPIAGILEKRRVRPNCPMGPGNIGSYCDGCTPDAGCVENCCPGLICFKRYANQPAVCSGQRFDLAVRDTDANMWWRL